jgi:hypothetical protein
LEETAMQLVPQIEKPKGNVIDDIAFRRPSVPDQLRIMAARLDAGEWPEPEVIVVVLAYTDPKQQMVCVPGGTEDVHPYFMAGMLQNAALTCLDEASAEQFIDEEL